MQVGETATDIVTRICEWFGGKKVQPDKFFDHLNEVGSNFLTAKLR